MTKPNDGLGDIMFRDPLSRPLEVPMAETPYLRDAFLKVVPETKRKQTIILSAPVTRPRLVIGAKVGPRCDGCGREVWVSPSMQAALADGVDACVACIECLANATETR